MYKPYDIWLFINRQLTIHQKLHSGLSNGIKNVGSSAFGFMLMCNNYGSKLELLSIDC